MGQGKKIEAEWDYIGKEKICTVWDYVTGKCAHQNLLLIFFVDLWDCGTGKKDTG